MNFENQSTFGEVMNKIIVVVFLLTHSVYIYIYMYIYIYIYIYRYSCAVVVVLQTVSQSCCVTEACHR